MEISNRIDSNSESRAFPGTPSEALYSPMWIAQFDTDKLFHRVSSAVGDGNGHARATAFCKVQGTTTDVESEEITCPKCRELHITLTLGRLNRS